MERAVEDVEVHDVETDKTVNRVVQCHPIDRDR